MGQLEKYGLYVLCLVIFLILGVTIWGGGEAPAPGQRQPTVANAALDAVDTMLGAGKAPAPRTGGTVAPIDDLLQPSPNVRAPEPEKRLTPKPAVDDGGEKKAVDATGPKPEPVPGPTTRSYTIRKGDTLGEIARRELGSASRYPEIQALNAGLDPARLAPGKTIVLPAASKAGAAKAEPSTADKLRLVGHRAYKVAKGDTFEGIALKELGSRGRVDEIRALNPAVDPRKIVPGQELKLPVE